MALSLLEIRSNHIKLSHCLAMLVTNSLTDCRLGNLIDVVTVIDVDDEK